MEPNTIKAIFVAALEKSTPAERAAYLDLNQAKVSPL
jgi:hypothetical protein